MPYVQNPEVAERKDGICKWKGSQAGSTLVTLGFTEGGLKYSIALKKIPVLNNNKTFSHWKETQDPMVTITVSKLYQDAQTELLAGAVNSFRLAAAGQTVATGRLDHEITGADAGATKDCAHFAATTLMNVNKAQADPDTLELQFESIGYPTFDNTPGT